MLLLQAPVKMLTLQIQRPETENQHKFSIALGIALLAYLGFIGKETGVDLLGLLTHSMSVKSA
jgi:hypothetical protein